jgi:tRNA pseudouridine55 synthase
MTSHDVVGFVRGLTGVKKVGHTGTLDPMAEGVLPVCAGKATRVIEFIGKSGGGKGAGDVCSQHFLKAYDCEARFGVTTDTLDVWGAVTAESDASDFPGVVTPERVREVFALMTGEVEQIPPAYAAIKYKGRRLYEYARRGEEIPAEALRPRKVCIESIDVTDVVTDDGEVSGERPSSSRAGHQDFVSSGSDNDSDAGPEGGSDNSSKGFATVRFSVVCSGGTYVRSIVRDAGEALGCGAAMSALTRTRSGVFTLADAHTREELERAAGDGRLADLMLPPEAAISFMPSATLGGSAAEKFVNGMNVNAAEGLSGAGSFIRVYDENRFIGVGKLYDGIIRPYKVITK